MLCLQTPAERPRAVHLGRYSNSQEWHRSSCSCLGMVFEVVMKCATCAICLTDAQPPTVPNEMLTRVRQGEEQKHKHETDPVYHPTCILVPRATASSHLGATGWASGATSWQFRVLCCTAQPSCMSGVSQWGQTWQDGKHPPPRGCRVQVFPKLLLGPSHRDNVSSGSLQTAGENPGKAL